MIESVNTFAPGLLLAMPKLGDANFHRSVVFMLDHGEEGAMGLVINRIGPMSLGDLAKGEGLEVPPSRQSDPVFLGGPVEPQRGFVFHDFEWIEEKQMVIPGVFVSVTLDALKPILRHDTGRVRFCLGYAGWGPNQLEQEIAQSSWLFTEATTEAVFSADPTSLWDTTLRGMGMDPFMLFSSRGKH